MEKKIDLSVELVTSKNDYNEDEIQIIINSAEEFNKVIIKIIPENQRYNYDNKLGTESTHFENVCEIGIQDALIRSMQKSLHKAEELINSFLFELEVFIVTKQKTIKTTKRISVQTPWEDIKDINKFPYGKTVFFENISDAELNSVLDLQITNELGGINSLDIFKQIKILNSVINANIEASNLQLVLELNGKEISYPVTIEKIKKNESLPLSFQLLKNLDELLLESFDSYDVEGYSEFFIDFIIKCRDHLLENKKIIISKRMPNPWFEIKRFKKVEYSKLIKNTLDASFSNWNGEINEDDEWIRFSIDNLNFQTGLRESLVYICIDLNNISLDANSKEMHTKIKKVNKKFKSKIKLNEVDNHFVIETEIDNQSLSTEKLSDLISEMIIAAQSSDVVLLMASYESLD